MALKRELNAQLTLYMDESFPSTGFGQQSLRYEAVVGIGGNVGDVRRRFRHLLVRLQREAGVRLLATGPILKNPPFGYLEQDDFYNSVLLLSTSMQPRAFLRFLLRLEKKFGRRRSFANAPRTLDLDILFFDDRVIQKPDLIVPHPHWHKRESVVIPLAYLGKKR
ncbi:MAG: 2-amino-4-hydroxy-6-hydroxymethyldihydropteridine diphosphokinase [Campylobacterota bacterium]|nr:2-amino-4-hydroxy-6-hydroxymethyldihydropteridine diphosphokinase [Campylobacterota bacterium]